MGLVAPWHVESSWVRDWTHVTCTSRKILLHCTTKKVSPANGIFKNKSQTSNYFTLSESESCSVVSDSLWSHGLYMEFSWNSPGQNIGVGSLSLLQEIFPTQGSNPSLPHCRQILYQLSHNQIFVWTFFRSCFKQTISTKKFLRHLDKTEHGLKIHREYIRNILIVKYLLFFIF